MTRIQQLTCIGILCLPCFSVVGMDPILSSSDRILAIDSDGGSNYPQGEGPNFLVDGNSGTKYLNFAGPNSGFIVSLMGGPVAVSSFQLTTANDAPDRDPTTWQIYGTNDPVLSTDNSSANGGELWTLLSSGNISLPATRLTAGPVISFPNATPYSAYRMVYPTLNGAPLFQIADAQFFDGANNAVLDISEANSVLATHEGGMSNYPRGEGPRFALDGNSETKYLNFGGVNSGFIVNPEGMNSGEVVRAFSITSANDSPNRDPIDWQLYGTNDAIASTDNSVGDAESWTIIDSGTLSAFEMPTARLTDGTLVSVDNNATFDSYKMIFPTRRGQDNSIQFANVQFFNAVPEPSSIIGLLFACGAFSALRRRS